MKKIYTVTITKEVEVDIPDELLTDEAIQEFAEYMFPVITEEELMEYAAQYVARWETNFVEGIGTIGYTILDEDVEVEHTESRTLCGSEHDLHQSIFDQST